ncbi:MAG: SUMF1/EgtB/PvdO family nonheme iron enzyme [Phycisphaerae bacterium]|jgi:formylglycine-generating enzyme required for sulfatase activity
MKKLLAVVYLILIFCIGIAIGDTIGPTGIVLKYINDPGFTGYMSKYETTNAQYCQFLNAALASHDITVSSNAVTGLSGDYAGQLYYDLAGQGYTFDNAINGGAARINYTCSSFTVDSGFENHPVTYVSWYGATAFCNYYSYRLPTENEWQAVADFDGSYIYGCGTSIDNSKANYYGSTHPDGTTVIGSFGEYGYGMCDMAGNVLDWTSTISGNYYRIRGGGWNDSTEACKVSYSGYNAPDNVGYTYGFRVVPEPASAFLLIVGMGLFRLRNRKR